MVNLQKMSNQEVDQFQEFPKIHRLSRECVITEKIDGTNAQIYISDEGKILAGSRSRWLTMKDDNFGFAEWALEHHEELLKLGPGRHFGEWWGHGIQRTYGLTEKRLSLFNVVRWCRHGETPQRIPTQDPRIEKYQDMLPECVGLVPLLYRGEFSTEEAKTALVNLSVMGSVAAPGFMKPEGIIIFHIAGNVGFKKTIEKDDEPKGKSGVR